MNTEKYPKLTVVGAGPGDPDLITIKAVNALGEADVILYDALVNKEILKYAASDSLKIYVGKRNKHHTYSQEQINTLIVDLAFTHGHVVRLKGGDPFVFGRGQEEIRYAELFNLETAVVPGISSSIAVPASVGIPVTHRGASESFWVITGTTQTGELSNDVRLASETNATAVILMGVEKLAQIVAIYKEQGKDETAIALIQNGTLPDQNLAIGTIETIEEIASAENIQAPAVIVIGEVVKQYPAFPRALTDLNYLFN